MNPTDSLILITQIFGGIQDERTGSVICFLGDYHTVRANVFLRFLKRNGYKAKELGYNKIGLEGRWILTYQNKPHILLNNSF